MAGQKGRRGNGEGSITQYSDGRWVARLTLPDGRRKAIYGKTRAEVAKKLSQAQNDRDAGLQAMGDERQTLGQYLTRWLDTIRTNVKPKTYSRYELDIRVHLAPALGKVRLTKLTPQHIQALYARELQSGLSPSSVAHLHAVLHRALAAAEQLDLITRNPADRVTAPRPSSHEMHIFTQEQAQMILAAVAGDRLEAAYILAMTTGLRQGEVLGLTWQDVNFEAATVHVRHTLHFDKGGKWRLALPKTDRSRRVVELSSMAVDALRSHRARQNEERLALGAAWAGHDFIFCNAVGEPLRGTHLLERHFLPLLARLGLPPARWHDLRHTFVSIAVAQGVPINNVSQMIGHSKTSMTMDVYAHLLPGQGKEAALAMERALRTTKQA